MHYSPDELQRKFDSLPEELREAITSVDFAKSLQEIGKTSGLHLDQLDQLFEEVGFVLLGMTHPSEFGRKIGVLFNLPEVARNSLVKEVDEKIFKPIRTSLMSLHSKTPKTTNDLRPTTYDRQTNEVKPREQAIPHETDYSMSRADILSAIENPVTKKVNIDNTPKRNVETSDPHLYLSEHNEMIQKMKIAPLAGNIITPKKSLAEEAVLVAQKKVEGDKRTPSPDKSQNPSPIIIQKTPPAPQNIQPLTIATSPLEKLSSVVRIPRQSVNITTPPTTKGVDPYREVV
ncbi:MAG: hypothetical protein AAB513_01875 [Patescibacteria group bacterium]